MSLVGQTLLPQRLNLRRTMAAPAMVYSAWAAWAALFATISLLILAGSERTVLTAYRDAAHAWFAGKDIYATTGQGFLYLPSAAIVFAPFAALPTVIGEIAWRLLMIGSFAAATRRLSTLTAKELFREFFPLMTLAVVPLCLAAARNGQSTLIMTAMMMLASVELSGGRLWRVTFWMSLGLAFKPLILVMICLAAALDGRLAWRLSIGVSAVLLFPFVTQNPAYVIDQYGKCLEMLRTASHCGVTELWAQPFSVLALLGCNVSESTQTLIRGAAAMATLGLCLNAWRRLDRVRAVEYLLAFSVLYILVFSPRTENNTYAMIGPIIGIMVGWCSDARQRLGTIAVWTCLALLAVGDEMLRLSNPHGVHIWLKPTVGISLYLCLVFLLFKTERDPQ